MHPRGAHRLHVRAEVPPGHEVRPADPQEPGLPDRLQHPGSAGQSRRRQGPGDGRLRPELLDRIAESLKLLGTKRAMVVHGQGMDEISLLGKTRIVELRDGWITSFELDPADYGIAHASIDALGSGDAIANAAVIRDILAGKGTGPRRDIVVLNAAAAIVVAGLADGFAQALPLAGGFD